MRTSFTRVPQVCHLTFGADTGPDDPVNYRGSGQRRSNPADRTPGRCRQFEWCGRQSCEASITQHGSPLGRQPRDIDARGSESVCVGSPPLFETAVGHMDGEFAGLDITDVRASRAVTSTRLAEDAGQSGFILSIPDPIHEPSATTSEIGPRSFGRVQTQAATVPPGRVTRAISVSPSTGSVMK